MKFKCNVNGVYVVGESHLIGMSVSKEKMDMIEGILWDVICSQQEKYDRSVELKGLPSTDDEESTAKSSEDGESPVDTYYTPLVNDGFNHLYHDEPAEIVNKMKIERKFGLEHYSTAIKISATDEEKENWYYGKAGYDLAYAEVFEILGDETNEILNNPEVMKSINISMKQFNEGKGIPLSKLDNCCCTDCWGADGNNCLDISWDVGICDKCVEARGEFCDI